MKIRIRAWMRCGDYDENDRQAFVMVPPESLAFELSTGWKDKNRREIFDSDIIERCWCKNGIITPFHYEVKEEVKE